MADRGPQDEGRQPYSNQQAPNPEQLQPTEEELKVIKSTSREATIYRGLPGGAVMAAVHKGIYRKAGPLSTGLAFFFGFVMGKASYQSVLTERILQLENSPIGDRIRERQRQQAEYVGRGTGGYNPSPAAPTARDAPRVAPRPDYNEGSAADVDSSQREMRGLDDTHRPDIDSGTDKLRSSATIDSPQEKRYTTYEELRRKARMEDSRRAAGSPSDDAVPLASYYDDSRGPAPRSTAPPADDWENRPIRRKERRNKYGDIIED